MALIPEQIKDLPSYITKKNTLNLFVLHKTSSKTGFGISTYSALERGMVISEYIGERKASNLKLDDSSYVLINDDRTNIDAKKYGNVARFFNHCPNEHSNKQVLTANLMIVPWKTSDTVTKVFFITIRDIKAFEPLCWDYGPAYSFDSDIELLDANTYLPINDHTDL